jgi:hypothetical protein
VTVASVSTYPALIDVFPAYRGDSFFVVEDEVVIVDRDRRIVDAIPVGPRARYAGGGGGGGSVAAVDLPPDAALLVRRESAAREAVLFGSRSRPSETAFETFGRRFGLRLP